VSDLSLRTRALTGTRLAEKGGGYTEIAILESSEARGMLN